MARSWACSSGRLIVVLSTNHILITTQSQNNPIAVSYTHLDVYKRQTRLSELLRVTGILEVESLLYYSRRVESAPQSKAALRALLQSQ